MFEKKFLMPLLCLVVVLSLSATATRGANILFVSSMTAVEDDALKAFMEGLGHTVTYIDDDEDEATTEAAAAAADLVFISESVGSGGIKNEITEIETPMIVGEPWAWDEMGLTEGSGGDDPAVTTDVEIVDPGHYMAAGLSGTVAVLTDILVGGNLGKGITGPEATVIATATLSDGVTYDVIFVYEKGAALPVAPADGSAQVAADIRIGFGFHAICYPVLSENAYALLGAAVDYALGLTGPVEPKLVGWWPLNEGSGDIAVDLSGSGNDGTISNLNGGLGPDGSVWANDPVRGTVISFNGTAEGAFVRAGDIPQMTLTNDFTWAFWAKHNAENTADNDIILGNRMDENAVDFVPRQFIKFTPTKFEWHMNGNGDDNLEYDDIPADVWLHHAVVKAGDQLTYYRNGIEASSGTFTQPLDFPQPLFFGGDNEASAGENWSGLMSDVRIYNRALTGLEILVLGIEKVILFEEDFEGLALGPNVDEALAGDAVWTDTPPDGWSIDSDIPGLGNPATDGVAEWAGWAFTDKEWWIAAAEDQDRSLFELGSGTVAVADPDEWDDADRLPIPISADPYDTWLSTPAIGISGCETGTLQLKFDSSWRPEFDDNYHQTANITASFDGGEPVVVMLWESDESSANYKPYATNETVIVNLDNPEGAKSVVLTFGLFDAGNDWWWAIDNVEVSGVLLEQDPVDPGSSGLLAWWTCDEGAGTVVGDVSGNGYDGVFVNGDPAWVEGIHGSAVELVGPTLIEAPPLNVELTEATMAGWIKPNGPQPDWSSIIMTRDPGLATGFNILGYQLAYHWNDTSDSWSFQGGDMIAEDGWTFAAVTIEPDKATFYVNGEAGSVNEISHGPCLWNSNVYLGGDGTAGWVSRRMNGALDDVLIYDRALSEAEIRYLAGERATPVDPGTDGLVAYYAFENDANDSSGNELHGTLVGDATFAEGPAGYGTALDLDGDGDYVDCGTPPQLDITEQITFTFWIKAVALDKGWNTVLSRGDDSWRSSRAGTNNYMEAAVGGTSGNYLFGVTPVDDDNWHHVGAVYDGATFYLYVDGELDSSEESTGNITVSSYPLFIGNNSQNTDREWTGLIDEVVIYNRALSVGEIRYLAGERAVDPSLVIYYSFDEVSDIVADQSGKGHDGVVVGDVTAEAEGMYNGAANFASGSYLDLDGPSFPAEDIPTSAMTLAAWIKCANTGGDHEIFSARASDESWLIHPEPKSSGDIRWLLRSYGGTTIFQIRAGTMTWDEWLHFAGTYDKDSGKAALYINGELIEEIVVENPADIAGDWDLGARVGYTIDNARPFTGLMDEFRMYTRALSQDEILTIMQGM